jgi:hypothetical protein
MKRTLTTVLVAGLVAAVVPASANASLRTGSVQDPQGDASALSGPALDLQSVAVSYDDVAGTLHVTWQYFNDVRVGYDPSYPPTGLFAAGNPVVPNVPTDYAGVQWQGAPGGGGAWSVGTTLQLYCASGSLSGTGTMSSDGRTVTAEFTNATLAGHDWQRGFGGAASGDDFARFWFDGFSDPLPPAPGPPPPPSGGGGTGATDSRTGVSIDNGAQYTNDPHVTLSVIAPSWAASLRVANDGGFLDARAFAVAPRVQWHLAESGPERLPKTVYVRFGGDVQTFTDDIILDQVRPTVTSATVVQARSGGARAAAARTTHTYRVRVHATDSTSGVGKVQFAVTKRRPSKLGKYGRIASYRGLAAPKFVRVRDRAGNYSRWRSIH